VIWSCFDSVFNGSPWTPPRSGYVVRVTPRKLPPRVHSARG
jgi:hypothetical protein